MGRLLVFILLGLLAVWSVSASRGGSGTRPLARGQTPADAVQAHARYLEDQRQIAAAAERKRRYDAGEMDIVERMEYEAELDRERRAREAEQERQRQAAYLRSVRGTRVSGGGPSSGK